MKKTFKKSMVVTTIVMVLLLVVALSTATFAWYTAQSNATVTETLVTSANSSSASLVIDTAKATSNTANQSTVEITMNQAIDPAIFNAAAPTAGTTTYANFVDKFITYTVDNAGNYASAPTATQIAAITNVVGSGSSVEQNHFYVTNVGGVNTKVEATVTINANYYVEKTVETDASVKGLYTKSGDTYTEITTEETAQAGTTYYELKANQFLRVAMFVDEVYVGTWAMSGQTAVQTSNIELTGENAPKAGDTPAAHDNYTATTSGSSITAAASVAPMGGIKVQLVAWFEGDSHTNAYAGTGALFTVTFNGATAA